MYNEKAGINNSPIIAVTVRVRPLWALATIISRNLRPMYPEERPYKGTPLSSGWLWWFLTGYM